MRVHVKLISSYLLVPRAATAQNGSGERKVTLHLPLPLLSLSLHAAYTPRESTRFFFPPLSSPAYTVANVSAFFSLSRLKY